MQDRFISHRTRNNTALIDGLTTAMRSHCTQISIALKDPKDGEKRLQLALADLAMDFAAIESAIVSEEQ